MLIAKKLKLAAVVIPILVGGISLARPVCEYASGRFEARVQSIIERETKEDKRAVKVLAEFNRRRALRDSVATLDWNASIEFIDNGGKIR